MVLTEEQPLDALDASIASLSMEVKELQKTVQQHAATIVAQASIKAQIRNSLDEALQSLHRIERQRSSSAHPPLLFNPPPLLPTTSTFMTSPTVIPPLHPQSPSHSLSETSQTPNRNDRQPLPSANFHVLPTPSQIQSSVDELHHSLVRIEQHRSKQPPLPFEMSPSRSPSPSITASSSPLHPPSTEISSFYSHPRSSAKSEAFKELEATVQHQASGIPSNTPTIEHIPQSFTENFHSVSQVETQPQQSVNLPILSTTSAISVSSTTIPPPQTHIQPLIPHTLPNPKITKPPLSTTLPNSLIPHSPLPKLPMKSTGGVELVEKENETVRLTSMDSSGGSKELTLAQALPTSTPTVLPTLRCNAQITISTEPTSPSAIFHLIPLRLLEMNLIPPPKNKISWCNDEAVTNSFSLFCQSPYNWTGVQEAIGDHRHWYCFYCQGVTVGRKSPVCETILQVRGSEEAHMAVEVQCLYSLLDVTREGHSCCWTFRCVTDACMDEGIGDQCSSHGVKHFTEQLSEWSGAEGFCIKIGVGAWASWFMLLQDQTDSLVRIPVFINVQDTQADLFFYTTGNVGQCARHEKKICELLMLRSSGKEQDGLDLFQMANLMSLEAIKICTLLQYAARIDFGPEKYLRSAGKFPFSSTIPCPWFASKISLGSSAASGNGSAMRIVSMGSHCSSSRGSGPDDIELFGAVYVRRAVFACGPRYMLVLGKLGDAKVIVHEGYPQAECCRLSVGHPNAIINVSEAVAALSVAGNFGFQPFSHGVACMTRAPIQKLMSSPELALRDNANLRGKSLTPMSKVEMLLPTNIGDYTDLFASLHHATNCGTIFRSTANPVPLNWSYPPIAYQGRALSVVSGTGIVRPSGLASPPSFGSLQKLDFERQMATGAGPGNELGRHRERNMTSEIMANFYTFGSFTVPRLFSLGAKIQITRVLVDIPLHLPVTTLMKEVINQPVRSTFSNSYTKSAHRPCGPLKCQSDPNVQLVELPIEAIGSHPLEFPTQLLGFRRILPQGKSVPQVLVQRHSHSPGEATWKLVEAFHQNFSEFHLEDKVILDEGGNVTGLAAGDPTEPRLNPCARMEPTRQCNAAAEKIRTPINLLFCYLL